MQKKSCILAAAVLALSLTACSAPSVSVAKTVYKPVHAALPSPDTTEKAASIADVPFSFSVGDKAADTADSTSEALSPDTETDSAATTPQTAAEEQAGVTTLPVPPAPSAEPASPEQTSSPTESPSAANTAAPAPEPPAQPFLAEQPLTQNAQPAPQPAPQPEPAPIPDPTPEPEPVPAPLTESIPQPVDIDAIVQQAQAYGLSIGLEWDDTATGCWDNPIAATPQSLYVSRDLCARLDWYLSSGFEAFCIWSEANGGGSYLVYVGYA